MYLEMHTAIYGLCQAGILVNKQLPEKLLPAGYHEMVHTSGLWRLVIQPVQFTLSVDDFGIKYVGK